MNLLSLQSNQLAQIFSNFDIIIVSPQSFESTPIIDYFNKKIIVDLYIPSVIEHQYTFTEQDQLQQQFYKDQSLYFKSFCHGNLFLCANDAQKHFYQGMMTAMGRLIQNQSFVTIPFFAEATSLSKEPSDKIRIAWIGGFWNWLHPEPFIDQVPQIISNISEIEIHFVGIDHPFAKFPMNQKAIQRVHDLQSKFPHNIFIQPWIDGADYLSFLQKLDAVILLSKFTTEEEYSIRTRLFEILESQVPVILNSNDELAKLISNNQLGVQIDTSSSLDFSEIITQLIASKENRNWQEFFNHYDKENIQKKLFEAIEHLKNYTNYNAKNPYFIQKLRWNHKILWKIKRLQKLSFSQVLNKFFGLFKS
ncbi:MAG: hypothetical protein KC646_15305 [Candidatus Cloacimonetes bacterium]|nr:hypothetical protein [Candidatus Cloacimonadota bacterium]